MRSRSGRRKRATVSELQSDDPNAPRHEGGVIFEFIQRGAYVRVAAVDDATGKEACIVADRTVSVEELQRLALAKLDWVMRTPKRGAGGAIDDDGRSPRASDSEVDFLT